MFNAAQPTLWAEDGDVITSVYAGPADHALRSDSNRLEDSG